MGLRHGLFCIHARTAPAGRLDFPASILAGKPFYDHIPLWRSQFYAKIQKRRFFSTHGRHRAAESPAANRHP